MTRKAYARRYAQAVFQIALETKELEKWQSDLSKIASLITDATFIAFLESPKIHIDKKTKLLSEHLGDINPLALNVIYLLMTRGRLNMLGDIVEEYQQLLDSYQGIERAEVTTAIPLDDDGRVRLTQRIGDLLGKKVVIKPEVDPSLIGGVIARVGGKLIDASTRSRLLALKNQLGGAGK